MAKKKETIIKTSNGMVHGPGMCVGVKANGFLFVSALRGHAPGDYRNLPEEPKEQARHILNNLRLVMEHVGGTLDDVVKVTLYLQDLKYRHAFNEVWMEFYPTEPPARIGVQVADANTQPGQNCYFTIDAIAVAD